MSRLYRVTYARTTYTEVEIEAADVAAAERSAEALLRTDPARCIGGAPLGKPMLRIVEVVADETPSARSVRRPHETVFPTREIASA